MPTVVLESILQTLGEIAPLRLAESWDNVGLLVGDRRASVNGVMTCLTITPEVVEEAVRCKVSLLVTHHPLPFKPLSRITTDSSSGQMLLRLIRHEIAVYSAHTAFDSSRTGINASWANLLGLRDVRPLNVISDSLACSSGMPDGLPSTDEGSGRFGVLDDPCSLGELARRAAKLVGAERMQVVESSGIDKLPVQKVAIACGSGGSMLAAAKRRGCKVLITGEATFHTCLEAKAIGVGLILLGHYHSERFAMQRLAEQLSGEWEGVAVFASQCDVDPLKDGL